MGEIANLKITWTSSRVLPNRIAGSGGKPDLSRLSSYAHAFERAGDGSPWRAPWTVDQSYSHVWESNLGGAYRNSTNWDKAWKRVVPLAATGPPPLTTVLPDVTLRCEQYLFPSGTAVMVVADIHGPLTDSRVLEIAEEMGQRSSVRVQGRQAMPMTAVVGMLLNDVEAKVFQALDPESVASRRAQTIATVISTVNA